jgi:putative chitinase
MSLKKLQGLAGVTADGAFGKNTFKACSKFIGITDHARAVHFFAQTGHETGNFGRYTENLNYSANGLRSIFGKYFPNMEMAQAYARQKERIGNKVYANRMGNGDENSGDGYKYRGRGALQLTGQSNYAAFAKYVEDDEVLCRPDVVSGKYSFQSAMFFFEKNKLWKICDEGLGEETIKKLTKRINGGYNGLDHRIELTNKYSGYKL